MTNLSLSSGYGNIVKDKCKCRNCRGIIPNDVKVFDTQEGNKLPLSIKELLKDSLLPSTRFKSIAFI